MAATSASPKTSRARSSGSSASTGTYAAPAARIAHDRDVEVDGAGPDPDADPVAAADARWRSAPQPVVSGLTELLVGEHLRAVVDRQRVRDGRATVSPEDVDQRARRRRQARNASGSTRDSAHSVAQAPREIVAVKLNRQVDRRGSHGPAVRPPSGRAGLPDHEVVDDLTLHEHGDEVTDGTSVELVVNLVDDLLDALGRRVREPASKAIRERVDGVDLFGLGHADKCSTRVGHVDNRYPCVTSPPLGSSCTVDIVGRRSGRQTERSALGRVRRGRKVGGWATVPPHRGTIPTSRSPSDAPDDRPRNSWIAPGSSHVVDAPQEVAVRGAAATVDGGSSPGSRACPGSPSSRAGPRERPSPPPSTRAGSSTRATDRRPSTGGSTTTPTGRWWTPTGSSTPSPTAVGRTTEPEEPEPEPARTQAAGTRA